MSVWPVSETNAGNFYLKLPVYYKSVSIKRFCNSNHKRSVKPNALFLSDSQFVIIICNVSAKFIATVPLSISSLNLHSDVNQQLAYANVL